MIVVVLGLTVVLFSEVCCCAYECKKQALPRDEILDLIAMIHMS